MKNLLKTLAGAACCAGLLAANAAQAHYLWIVPAETGARVYYGEADVLLKEKSPGKFDSVNLPKGLLWNPGGKFTEQPVGRTAEFFTIANSKDAPALLISEESGTVKDLSSHGMGIAKSNYYARHGQPGDGSASPLALDIQSRGPNTFVILYHGRPLKKAKLEVIAPNTWFQEHQTDAQGSVVINAPWRGLYVVHILHIDRTPGEFDGKPYEALRNHFTYSFVKTDGADPGPAAPPMQPLD